MKQIYTSLRRRVAVNPFTHIVLLLMQSISAYTDIAQAKFGLFLAIVLYGLFVAFLLWVVSLFCSEFLFSFIKSESGAVKIGIKWFFPLALAVIVMIFAPFGKVGAQFAPPGKLCELSSDCIGWVNLGTVGVGEMPPDLTFAEHAELIPDPQTSDFGEFCPVSYRWSERSWLEVGEDQPGLTAWSWTQLPIIGNLETMGRPTVDRHSQSCPEGNITGTCVFLERNVKLTDRQRVRVVGCAQVATNGPDYPDVWLQLQDPTYRNRPSGYTTE